MVTSSPASRREGVRIGTVRIISPADFVRSVNANSVISARCSVAPGAVRRTPGECDHFGREAAQSLLGDGCINRGRTVLRLIPRYNQSKCSARRAHHGSGPLGRGPKGDVCSRLRTTSPASAIPARAGRGFQLHSTYAVPGLRKFGMSIVPCASCDARTQLYCPESIGARDRREHPTENCSSHGHS
jgi:hypothetical protein